MAGFEIAAGTAGIISLGITVCQSLVDFYEAYKEYHEDIDHFCRNAKSLMTDLGLLKSILISADRKDDIHIRVEKCIISCQEDVRRLNNRLSKVRRDPKATSQLRAVGLRATYPFRRSTLFKHREIINDLRENLHGALQNFVAAYTIQSNHILGLVPDQVQSVGQKVDEVRSMVTNVHLESGVQRVLAWLSAPDPSTNYHAAVAKRQPQTGKWFMENFREWQTKGGSFLWLHGIPGSGKTILSSAALQHLLEEQHKSDSLAVAYFYFSFSDREKQSAENCIQSLIAQLGSQTQSGRDQLQELYRRCNNGIARPSLPTLLRALKNLIEIYKSTHIVIDALDECRTRSVLVIFLRNVLEWEIDTLHVLATSRYERDIAKCLDRPFINKISIESKLVDADIGIHVLAVLESDEKLKDLPEETKTNIHETLLGGASGMFQWVVCQLDVIRLCESNAAIKRALRSLPNTLEETYGRMLEKIDSIHYHQVYRVLQWLVCSTRPITAIEAIEAVAMTHHNGFQLDPDERLHSPKALLSMCGDLVNLEHNQDQDIYQQELRLTHFSIKEYLISPHARNDRGTSYMIQERQAHREIAQLCVSYLSTISDTSTPVPALKDYPLAPYAANNWIYHFLAGMGESGDGGSELLWKDILESELRLSGWLRIWNPDDPPYKTPSCGKAEKPSSPLYYASLCGIKPAVEDILRSQTPQSEEPGRYGSALQAAAYTGHVQIVKALLDAKADPNTNNGIYGCALQAACYHGSEEIVRMLYNEGAKIDCLGGRYYNSLTAAAYKGNTSIARFLIEMGAEVNVYPPVKNAFHSPLYLAALQGHDECVKLLLDSGAEKDDSGGYYGTALAAAASRGHEATLRLLGSYNVRLDATGKYGTALETAQKKGEKIAVQILRDLADARHRSLAERNEALALEK